MKNIFYITFYHFKLLFILKNEYFKYTYYPFSKDMIIFMIFCKNTQELKFEQVIVIFYNGIYKSSINHKIAQNIENP